MSNLVNKRIHQNEGGFHADIDLEKAIYISYGGETLEVIFNGHRNKNTVSVTMRGTKVFNIDLAENRRSRRKHE